VRYNLRVLITYIVFQNNSLLAYLKQWCLLCSFIDFGLQVNFFRAWTTAWWMNFRNWFDHAALNYLWTETCIYITDGVNVVMTVYLDVLALWNGMWKCGCIGDTCCCSGKSYWTTTFSRFVHLMVVHHMCQAYL